MQPRAWTLAEAQEPLGREAYAMIWWILLIGLLVALVAGWAVDRKLRRRGVERHSSPEDGTHDDGPRRFGSPGGV